MATTALDKIDIGGPCKVVDATVSIYFEEGVKLTPQPKYRGIASSVAGEGDGVLTDLVWTITGRPKAIWTAAYRKVLLPNATDGSAVDYFNWACSGQRLCGSANRAVSIVGSDSNGFDMVRCCLTKPANVFGGVGKPLYDEVEWTAFIGQGKALNDAGAFMTANTTAWSQADYPTGHQEQVCTGAWGAVAGWDTVWAEDGFKLTHELGLADVKSGAITVDKRITKYRAMFGFLPQEPTSAQLVTALNLQNTGGGIGARQSAMAYDFIMSGAGMSITGKSMGLNKGGFVFDNKANRPGEFGMITALPTPGDRLVFA
jgi:hypothetical protein